MEYDYLVAMVKRVKLIAEEEHMAHGKLKRQCICDICSLLQYAAVGTHDMRLYQE